MRIRTFTGMGIGKAYGRTILAGLATISLVVFAAVDSRAEDTLSCYKGDKNTNIYIGEIAGADFQNAAGECNSFFADCNGECFGCYLDEDSTREVCVDSQGNKFTR